MPSAALASYPFDLRKNLLFAIVSLVTTGIITARAQDAGSWPTPVSVGGQAASYKKGEPFVKLANPVTNDGPIEVSAKADSMIIINVHKSDAKGAPAPGVRSLRSYFLQGTNKGTLAGTMDKQNIATGDYLLSVVAEGKPSTILFKIEQPPASPKQTGPCARGAESRAWRFVAGGLGLRHNHGVEDVDDTVRADDVGLDDLGTVHRHGTVFHDDVEFAALQGLDLAGLHISGHHFAGDDVVGENAHELGLVLGLEQHVHGAGGQLGEGRVRRCEDGERTSAAEGFGETGGLDRGDERGEVGIAGGNGDDGLRAGLSGKGTLSERADEQRGDGDGENRVPWITFLLYCFWFECTRSSGES